MMDIAVTDWESLVAGKGYSQNPLALIEEVIDPIMEKVLVSRGYRKEFHQFENGDKAWRWSYDGDVIEIYLNKL